MAQSAKYLLVGSIEAYSGKSGIVLGIAHLLGEKGLSIAYTKPVGTCASDRSMAQIEGDIQFISETLSLSHHQVQSPLVFLERETIAQRLQGRDSQDYLQVLQQYIQQIQGDLTILEGMGTLSEGHLFNLSAEQIVRAINGAVLLVARYDFPGVVDSLLQAKHLLGDRLLGVAINGIPVDAWEESQTLVKPFLEKHGVRVLGLLPNNALLHSVRVGELVEKLGAEVLCRSDRLNLMVESLTIGAMNVNTALEYFRRGNNKAVVTGGDRTDLQLAALETSTNCLILTGHVPPQSLILSRAEDLEIPILSVNLDTLTTVEIIDRAFGKVRLQEAIKVRCIQELMEQHFDIDRFMDELGLEPAVAV